MLRNTSVASLRNTQACLLDITILIEQGGHALGAAHYMEQLLCTGVTKALQRNL